METDPLASTRILLERAFPEGISAEHYLPVLVCLYPHMSDRSLARVVGQATDRDAAIVLNDVYKAAEPGCVEPSAMQRTMERLLDAGFQEWVDED